MSPQRRAQPPAHRAVVATADDGLLEQVLELASVAGVEVEVAHDLVALRRSWSSAPLVLLGADLAARLGGPFPSQPAVRPGDGTASRSADGGLARPVAALPGRRAGVVLVSTDLDDAGVWELAVRAGAEQVAVLPDARAWLGERLGQAGRRRGRRAVVVGVVGGRGGAGASCLAAALALAARREGRGVVLVDADPLGGGIDLLVGAEESEGLRWSDLIHASGHLPARTLVEALPEVAGLRVLSWDRGQRLRLPADPVRAVMTSLREAAELVVVDLARDPELQVPAVLDLVETVLLVVPAEVRATAAAGRVALQLSERVSDLRLVVRGPAPGGLDPDLVASSLGLPLAGWLVPEPNLAEAIERGDPPGASGRGPLARLARELLGTTLSVDPAAA